MKAKSCIAKLRRLGVLEQFRANLTIISEKSLSRMHDEENDKSFELFVSRGFVWSGTPEGHKFWINISNK